MELGTDCFPSHVWQDGSSILSMGRESFWGGGGLNEEYLSQT